MQCTCENWKKSIHQLDAAAIMIHIHGLKYTGATFEFCPWCGLRLVDDNSCEIKGHDWQIFPTEPTYYAYRKCDLDVRFGSGLLNDDFGNSWMRACPNCGEDREIVRPGQVQCSHCGKG